MADEHGALHELIRRARHRQVLHLAIDALSFAAVIGLGGAILLLIVGAQILNWYWVAALFAASLAAAEYRSRARLQSGYRIAQSIDRRLGLKDALSTAYYFSRKPSTEIIEYQRETAENLARTADVERGVPFRAPRTAYVNLILVAVACGMFGLRYGIHRNLDLRAPLVAINFDGLFDTIEQMAGLRPSKIPDTGRRAPSDSTDPLQAKTTDEEARDQAALQPVNDGGPNEATGSPDGAAKENAKNSEQMPPGTNPLDSGEKGESSLPNDPGSNQSQGADSKSGQQNASQDAKEGKQAGSSDENSSLASKLRDALSNMLAKMKPQSKQGAGKQSDSSQSASSKQARQGERQEGDAKSGQEQADSSAESQSEGDQEQGGKQQAANGKTDGKSNHQPNSPDGKSGIGSQDGDKAAREAAELAAMGKLSEIIGKRAANISGEVMVEVSSGKQQLKTQYSQQNAAHSDAGGEINRDEVPLAYQQYVQQYFAQVRKLPAGKAKTGAGAAAPSDGKKTAPSSSP